MAQTRFLEYLSDDDTFSLNLQTAGIFPAGCYRGFDTADIVTAPVNVGNIAVQFKHEQSGFSYRDKDGITRSRNALCVSKQGVKIVENAPCNAQVEEVVSGQRIDAIIMRHLYANTEGGTYATYISIQGTSTEKPIIQIDDVLLGWLLVTPTSVTWQKVDARQFGGLNFADQQNVFTAKQMAEILPIGILNATLDVSEGNMFEVIGNSFDFITHTKDSITGGDKNGARIVLFPVGDLTISDYQELQDQGIAAPPLGKKWVNTNTGQNLLVKAGGVVELIETENFYQVVNFYDSLKNVAKLSNDLNNKHLWWLSNGFVSSVKQVVAQNNIASSINANILQVESGIIKTGPVGNLKNITNVEISTTELLVDGIETAYPINSVVYIDFSTSAAVNPVLNCSAIADSKQFRAVNGNQFDIKNGSIACFLQKDDGLWLLGGLEKKELWVTPVTPANVSVHLHNGPFKYRVCENGRIEFEGSISIGLAQASSQSAIIATLPRSLFQFPDWSFHKRIFVPPFENGATASSYMYYFIDGQNVNFLISSDNYITSFCFNGCYINYK